MNSSAREGFVERMKEREGPVKFACVASTKFKSDGIRLFLGPLESSPKEKSVGPCLPE